MIRYHDLPNWCATALIILMMVVGCNETNTRSSTQGPLSAMPAPLTPAQGASSNGTTTSAALRARLEWAISIAERIPSPSFDRDRARMREAIVEAALARGWLDAARDAARGTQGWRRGEAQVSVAQALNAVGRSQEADDLVAEAMSLDSSQWPDWARARVQAACAAYRIAKGDDGLAMELLRGPDAALAGGVQVARTAVLPPEHLVDQERMFERAIATKNFDLAKTGIDGQFALLRRWKDQPADLERVLAATASAIKGLPIDLQVRYECDLALLLDSLGRGKDALAALSRGAYLAGSTQFLPEDVIPVGVRVAIAQWRLGLREEARSQSDSLTRTYDSLESNIVDMKRATSLRALAELRATLGETDAARALYARALDAALLNPNSRPRADDICMVVCSMATAGVEPDARLCATLDATGARLGAPW